MTWLARDTLHVQRDENLAEVILDRPDRLNAFTPEMVDDLRSALQACSDAEAVRAVTITGAGRAFCSGADLTGSWQLPASEVLRRFYNPLILDLRALPKPVIAKVHGPAAGVGASLALGCDFVLMSEAAYLLFAFVNLGLAPDAGGLLFAARRSGTARATQLAMLGNRLGASDALLCNLADEVYPASQFEASSHAFSQQLASGATAALATIKAHINQTLYADLDDHLEREASMQDRLVASADFHEAATAFRERRAPRFTGN